ncbi:zinc finger protein 431-like isoform X3 [Cydia pomonella]|uniref:zinc finger protein 431-like isoform X3 n=1 Tax=Cydia pomonella TaxID=82600 RepID=UPI002ADDE4F3|nr:zinc finger protein 431-like isoform X3 [Cydia pomonella]
MDFDEIVVKESPGLCRCCLSEGCYKDLGSEYSWMSETEIYADMLLECFDISISQHPTGPNGSNRLICEVCITRLRDACNFKKQVLESEKKFVDMVGRGEFRPKVLLYQTQMKTEHIMELEEETGADDSGEVEYLEEDTDFVDEDLLKNEDYGEASVSEDITVSTLAVKGKRGRPKKTAAKPEKKAKVAKTEEKPKKAVAKGKKRPVVTSDKPISATKRNRLMKANAAIVLETSTVVPFKWQRQHYLCFYCHKTFKSTDSLKDHTRDEHKKSNIKAAVSYLRRDEKVKIDVSDIECRLCNVKLDDLTSLLTHLTSTHDKSFTEQCGSFGLIPYKLESGSTSFQCAICSEEFQYFIKLNEHMNLHFGNYICELCGKGFLSQNRLRCHVLSHGSGFKCTMCSETFDSLTLRINHETKIHNKEKLCKCFYCDETFPNYMQRKRHHHSVHNLEIPAFNCPICHKAFEIESKMQVHIKEVHLREKNYSCTMCEQKFFSKTHVQKHMVKHFGERVHQCEICKKSYARKQTLRDHMRIHSNDKRYVCALCSQAFVQNNSLRLHMRVHHPESVNA